MPKVLFTTQNAREMAQRSWDKRKQAQPIETSQSEPSIAVLPKSADDSVKDELRRTREQIEKLNDLIDDCTDPKDQDALTRAKDRQFRIWARLAQIPTDPKPAQARSQQRRAIPEPVAIPPVVGDGSTQAQ